MDAPQPELSPEGIAKRCMDSPGYVLFAAVLTNKKDAKGFPMLDTFYKRYQLSFEATGEWVKILAAEVRKDMDEFMRSVAPPA